MYRNTKKLYCEKRAGQGWTVLQYSGQPSHDTAGARRAGRRRGVGLGVRGVLALGAQAGRWAQAARRRGAEARRTAGCAGASVRHGARGRRQAQAGALKQHGSAGRRARQAGSAQG